MNFFKYLFWNDTPYKNSDESKDSSLFFFFSNLCFLPLLPQFYP